jgi:hypothetical protein
LTPSGGGKTSERVITQRKWLQYEIGGSSDWASLVKVQAIQNTPTIIRVSGAYWL